MPALPRAFAALRHRNYRLWFAGQLVSLMGTWMQTTAQGYLVYELTRSPAFLGYVGFAAGAPSWLLMLYGGVAADRFPKRSVLIAAESAMMLLAFALAGLAFMGWVRPWHVLALSLLTGVATAFDAPARQSFVLDMVGREDLANAIALNSGMFNLALAAGPAVAGLAYAAYGPGTCFLLNGVSFLAVIAALASMRLPKAEAAPPAPLLEDLKEGVRFSLTHPLIRPLILLVVTSTLFGFAIVTLMPAWAVEVLRGDARTNGFLFSARGVGALAGSLIVASAGRRSRGRLLGAGAVLFPVFVLLFSFQRGLAPALLLVALTGTALILTFNVANALVQTACPDRLRGRVMGVYSLVFFGLAPLGALWIGPAAQALGAPWAVRAAGLVSLAAAALIFACAPRLWSRE